MNKETLFSVIAYIIYMVFWWRFLSHAIVWCKTTDYKTVQATPATKITTAVIAVSIIDLFFLKRLFNTNKLLWIGSWTFHISFLLVILRHLKYFMNPVPECMRYIQPLGIFAGYILPLSFLYTLVLRISVKKDRYISFYNFFILGVLFVISVSGIMMRTIFRIDIIQAKIFISGILSLQPDIMPDSNLFMLHFIFFLLLLPFLPLHIFTAPFVSIDARRREEEMNKVMHDQ